FARCGCPDTLPATEHFTFDVKSGTLNRDGRSAVPDDMLAEIARAETQRARVHLATSAALRPSAAVTYAQRDTVFGLVAAARDLGTVLLEGAERATEIVDGDERM